MKENKNSPEYPRTKLLPGVLFIVLLIILDQITKIVAVHFLGGGQKVILIPGVLEFTLIHNSGAAFGILQNAMLFFFIITAAALVMIFFILSRTPSARRYLPMRLCLYARTESLKMSEKFLKSLKNMLLLQSKISGATIRRVLFLRKCLNLKSSSWPRIF